MKSKLSSEETIKIQDFKQEDFNKLIEQAEKQLKTIQSN